jgi:hypothetical protein
LLILFNQTQLYLEGSRERGLGAQDLAQAHLVSRLGLPPDEHDESGGRISEVRNIALIKPPGKLARAKQWAPIEPKVRSCRGTRAGSD